MNMEKIKQFAEEKLDELNLAHTKNVVELALRLAEKENADKEIVEAAAWLHDIGRTEASSKHGDHHLYSVKITEKLLNEIGADEEFIKKVVKCIEEHMGPTGEGLNKLLQEAGIKPEELPRPSSPESKCVYDADMIDFAGPLGIAKVIYLEARAGTSFVEAIKLRKMMTEAAYRSLYTETGKEVGKEYYEIAKQFYEKLNMEE